MMRVSIFAWVTLLPASLLGTLSIVFSDLLPTALGGYADQRFILIALLGFLVAASALFLGFLCKLSFFARCKSFSPVMILSLSFLLLTMPFASQSYAWLEPAMFSAYFLAVVLAGVTLQISGATTSFAEFLIALVSAACFLYGAMSINVYLFALFDGVTNLVNFIPWGFVNIRYWSHIATWLIPLLPLAVLVGPLKGHRLWRIIVAIGAGLWWWIMFLSTSRGSALGIAFGVLLAAALMGRQAAPWLKIFLFHLLIGVVFWLILSVTIPSLISDQLELRSLKTDSSGRMPLFIEAWKMSLQNFPFGMGPQSWLTHEVLTDAYAGSKKFGHPHNMYLMWAAEYGWLLILALGILVVQAICNFWRRRVELLSVGDRSGVVILAGFTASVSAALFHAGVSAVFLAPGSMLVGLFVLIVFWALITPDSELLSDETVHKGATRKQQTVGVLTAGIIVIAWAVWAGGVWRYYVDMRIDEITYHEQSGEGTLPRFWLHGNFPRR